MRVNQSTLAGIIDRAREMLATDEVKVYSPSPKGQGKYAHGYLVMIDGKTVSPRDTLETMRDCAVWFTGYLDAIAARVEAKELLDGLKMAHAVQYDPANKVWVAWFGGASVLVYNREGRNVDMWSLSDPTAEKAIASMRRRIAEDDYPVDRANRDEHWGKTG